MQSIIIARFTHTIHSLTTALDMESSRAGLTEPVFAPPKPLTTAAKSGTRSLCSMQLKISTVHPEIVLHSHMIKSYTTHATGNHHIVIWISTLYFAPPCLCLRFCSLQIGQKHPLLLLLLRPDPRPWPPHQRPPEEYHFPRGPSAHILSP